MRARKKKIILLVTVLITALIFFGFGAWWYWANQPVIISGKVDEEVFVIRRGEGLGSIANRLDHQGLVNSGLAFRIMVQNQGYSQQIQAGDFRLSPSMALSQIVESLTHGTLDIWLTFPEGWRREEFGRRLASNLNNFDYEQFLDLTQALEGRLFPDTYLVPRDADASQVIRILTDNFENKFDSDLRVAAVRSGLSQEQVLILASMVEREVASDRDRPLVAGILIKRWLNNWKLQVDASVQYALADRLITRVESSGYDGFGWWPKVRSKDLEIDSPYNTYLKTGLPPGPICSPGLASIKAVIFPQSSDYWFYLSDPSGVTHYSRTNQEHISSVEKYLR